MIRSRRGAARVAAVALLLSACSAGANPTPSPNPSPLRWDRVPLPDALTAVTLATAGDRVLVGAYGPDRPRPRLLLSTGPQTFEEVPLTPRSPYAFEARWFSLATRGEHVEAVGGARGGAHGNYRWSTWSGDTARLAEQEQPFGVFGSWGAGDLVGVGYAADTPVILGAWQSERTGLDIATWLRTGTRWARQPSTGTALASTPQALVSAGAIASDGTGLILAGSVTRLAPGSVHVDPAVWTSPAAVGPWRRVDLPRTETGGSSEAHAATCASQSCLVAGVQGAELALWEVQGATARTLTGIPDITVPENGRALAPVTLRGDDLVVAPTADGTMVLRHRGRAWSTEEGPKGTPVSLVEHSGELWVVATDQAGNGTLWRGHR